MFYPNIIECGILDSGGFLDSIVNFSQDGSLFVTDVDPSGSLLV